MVSHSETFGYDGIFDDHLVAKLLQCISVKEFLEMNQCLSCSTSVP